MHPVTDRTYSPSTRDSLTVKDEHLARVLAGEDTLLFDGAMGTMLQRAGVAGDAGATLPLDHPEVLVSIHRAYVEAGSEVATTATFTANRDKLGDEATVRAVFAAAAACAREAGARYVAGDIGPTGSLLEPLGDLSFDEAYDIFAEEARAARDAGCDLIIIETMTDLLETKAAVLAAKENTTLPIFATMTFGEHGKTFLGVGPDVAAVTLEALGVQVLGINCSLGPAAIEPLAAQVAALASVPVIVQANAGLPTIDDAGNNVYSVGPDEYATAVKAIVEDGARVIGGCCGTDPAYIENLAALLGEAEPRPAVAAVRTLASSRTLATFESADLDPYLDPEGAAAVAQALTDGEVDDAVDEAIDQADDAEVIALAAGNASAETLQELLEQVQTMATAPLLVSSANAVALEEAVRTYPGKPAIELTAADAALEDGAALARHYGCALLVRVPEGATDKERAHLEHDALAAADAGGLARENVLFATGAKRA